MSNYNPAQKSKYIMYFDMNSLYGEAMSRYLPSGGFEWVEELENFDVSQISDDSNEGYIFEVDLEYPQYLHDSYKYLPLAAELKNF